MSVQQAIDNLTGRLLPELETGARPDAFADLRRRARTRLMQHGFPTLKTEAWKYTPLRLLEKRALAEVPDGGARAPELPFQATVLFLDQGRLDPGTVDLPSGMRLQPLSPEDGPEPDYGDRAGAFAWLNLARFEQGWKLVVEETPSHPLVLALATSDEFAGAAHPRLRLEVRSGVRLVLVETLEDHGAGLVNTVFDIDLDAGAGLDHVFDRRGHDSALIQRTCVSVASGGEYRFTALDRGNRLGRCDLQVNLNGPGARGQVNGAAILDGRQHVDYHTDIRHQTGGTFSREEFRMLAGGSATGVFNGRIYIHAGADDSHSELRTGNLLLSDSARINTKPELEIHAEEVTASHGATVGQLDSDAMFYLRSRGLDADAAAALLKYGFAATPLEGARPAPVRDWLLAGLKSRL